MAATKKTASQVMEQPCSELATQNAKLQERVSRLLDRAKYVTPEIASLVEIYQECEILGEMLRHHQLAKYADDKMTDDEKNDKATELYNMQYRKYVDSLLREIEHDITNTLIDNISIFGEIEYDKLCDFEKRYEKQPEQSTKKAA